MITANGIDTLEFDTKLAGLWGQLEDARAEVGRHMNAMHRELGDKMSGYGKRRRYGLTDDEVFARFELRAVAGQDLTSEIRALTGYGTGKAPTYAVAVGEYLVKVAAAGEIEGQICGMNATYRQAPWQRYFLCRANNGHIHSTQRDCHTVDFDTIMEWRPELSGHSVEEAVKALGERLCTHCFPDAPAEWKNGELRETRDAKDARTARKDEIAAGRAMKTLTGDEEFRSEHHKERISTVAACEALIRAAVEQAAELKWWLSPAGDAKWTGDAESLTRLRQSVALSLTEMEHDAGEAERVLLAREAGNPGWGRTAAQIAKVRASKARAALKAWPV
jgi:hypothetical protein